MKRRDFLKGSSSVVLSSVAGAYGARAYARVNNSLANLLQYVDESERVLVMVFLNGGNDGLNTLIPLSQLSNLSAARPHVFLPENRLLKISGSNLAMHPSLVELKEMYDEGKILAIQNVGYENPNFSHFRSTDIWMSGSASDELITSGWVGRYLDDTYPGFPFEYPNVDTPDPLAIEIGRSTSLLFQGPSASMGMAIHDPEFFYDLIDSVDAPVPPGAAGERIRLIRILAKQSEKYSTRVRSAAGRVVRQSEYPSLKLADQLKIVARLIAGGLQTKLYLVQLSGFDTHDNQVSRTSTLEGEHSNLLSELSQSLKAFTDDCDFLGISDRVLGMTFSEFGRRIRSNGSFGTDHGAAAPLFFFGSNVRGGIIGTDPTIPSQVTVRDNLPHEFEFRQVYSTVFQQWFCLPPGQVSPLIGEFETLDVVPDHLKCTPSTAVKSARARSIEVFPSPTRGPLQIRLSAPPQSANLQIVSADGRVLPVDVHRIDQDLFSADLTHLPAGLYFVRAAKPDGIETKSVVKN